MKRLVLLGGGHSHVEVLRRFGAAPLPGTELVLASPYPDSPYSGMLPGWIAGHYARDDCHIDLLSLTRFARCRFVPSACHRLDADARAVVCADGTILPYDVVSVDTGAASAAQEIPGATEHALPVKPVEDFMPRWDEMRERGRSRARAAPHRDGRRRRRGCRSAARDAASAAAGCAGVRHPVRARLRHRHDPARAQQQRAQDLHARARAARRDGASRSRGGARRNGRGACLRRRQDRGRCDRLGDRSLGAIVAEGGGSCHRRTWIHPRRRAPAIGLASARVRLRRHCRHRRITPVQNPASTPFAPGRRSR